MRLYEMTREDGKDIQSGVPKFGLSLRELWMLTDNTDEQNEAIGDLALNGTYVLDDGDAKFIIKRVR